MDYNPDLSSEAVDAQIKAKLGEEGFVSFETVTQDEDVL